MYVTSLVSFIQHIQRRPLVRIGEWQVDLNQTQYKHEDFSFKSFKFLYWAAGPMEVAPPLGSYGFANPVDLML